MAELLSAVRSLPSSGLYKDGTPEERAALLRELRELVDASEAVFLECLNNFDVRGDCETLNATRTTSAWLRKELKLAPGDATERVRISRGGHLHGAIVELRSGSVTYDQVRAIERATRHVPESQQKSAAETLTTLAQQVDVVDVRIAGHKLASVTNPDGAMQSADRQFERRHLTLSPLLDGMTHVDGMLDPEGATILATALGPFQIPAGHDDQRTAAQRRADGLVAIAESCMAHDDIPQQSGASTQLQVLVPFELFSSGNPGSGNPGSGNPVSDQPGAKPGAKDIARFAASPSSTPFIAQPSLERMSCAANVTRVVLDQASVPLDVGRTKRLFTPQQRLALAVRDGGCRFPDCHVPAHFTDAHHIVSWQSGGATDLSNGLLLCRYHHRQVHERGWEICEHDLACQRVTFASPYGRMFVSEARGP